MVQHLPRGREYTALIESVGLILTRKRQANVLPGAAFAYLTLVQRANRLCSPKGSGKSHISGVSSFLPSGPLEETASIFFSEIGFAFSSSSSSSSSSTF